MQDQGDSHPRTTDHGLDCRETCYRPEIGDRPFSECVYQVLLFIPASMPIYFLASDSAYIPFKRDWPAVKLVPGSVVLARTIIFNDTCAVGVLAEPRVSVDAKHSKAAVC